MLPCVLQIHQRWRCLWNTQGRSKANMARLLKHQEAHFCARLELCTCDAHHAARGVQELNALSAELAVLLDLLHGQHSNLATSGLLDVADCVKRHRHAALRRTTQRTSHPHAVQMQIRASSVAYASGSLKR